MNDQEREPGRHLVCLAANERGKQELIQATPIADRDAFADEVRQVAYMTGGSLLEVTERLARGEQIDAGGFLFRVIEPDLLRLHVGTLLLDAGYRPAVELKLTAREGTGTQTLKVWQHPETTLCIAMIEHTNGTVQYLHACSDDRDSSGFVDLVRTSMQQLAERNGGRRS